MWYLIYFTNLTFACCPEFVIVIEWISANIPIYVFNSISRTFYVIWMYVPKNLCMACTFEGKPANANGWDRISVCNALEKLNHIIHQCIVSFIRCRCTNVSPIKTARCLLPTSIIGILSSTTIYLPKCPKKSGRGLESK